MVRCHRGCRCDSISSIRKVTWSRGLVEQLRCPHVFLPRPDQKIGEGDDATHACRRHRHRHIPPVGHPQGRDPTCVSNAEASELTGHEGLFGGWRERVERRRELLEGRAAFLLPERPVRDEPIAELYFTGLEAIPHLACRKDVGRLPLLQVATRSLPPVIARRIPDRETAIDLRVQHEPWVRGTTWPPGPGFGVTIEDASVGRILLRLGVKREVDGRRARVQGARWQPGGQGRVHLGGPLSRERPPGHVEQKALTKPIVPGKYVEPGCRPQRHLGRWTDVLKVQVLEHGLAVILVPEVLAGEFSAISKGE